MFSKACEYGIRAAIYIASASLDGNRTGIKEIAKAIESPEPFTAKILQILTREGLIQSAKGVGGGFEITETSMKMVTLADIVNAIDGNKIYEGCGLGLPACNEKRPCPIHHQFKEIRNNLKILLKQASLHDMATGIYSGNAYLKI